MRINEVVNEGVLGSIGSGLKTAAGAAGRAVAGVADVAGRGIMQKYGGTSGGTYGAAQSGSAAQMAAGQMTGPLIAKMGQELQTQWLTQGLPALMKASNSTEPAQVDPADQAAELQNLINKTLKFKYDAPNVNPAADGGRAKAEATHRTQEIETAIGEITRHPPPGSGKVKSAAEYKANFTNLANAMAALMNLTVFQGGGAPVGGAENPLANSAMIALGAGPADLAKFNALVARDNKKINPTGSPTVDALLKAAKLL